MHELNKDIAQFKESFINALKKADTEQALEEVRVAFLGRKGKLAHLMSTLKELSLDEKKQFGPALNELKVFAEESFEKKRQEILQSAIQATTSKYLNFDVTAYKPQALKGSVHPLTLVTQQLEDIFISMGYHIADGPEVEHEHYNFEALNIPADHPARDMWDTFWLDVPSLLLRTHTSSVQVHAMEEKKGPLALVAPGRCYRHEATDASHDFQFMQIEGLFIDKNISLGHLLATVKILMQEIFQTKKMNIRVRPSFFPFTEPGIEIDVECPFCTKGCSVCKSSRWIEMCGAGLVHPNVLECCGIDPKQYSGFAFGLGLTRLTMLKYGIHDIRLLHSGKIDFLNQFQS